MSRPSWEQWALSLARSASERSEDPFLKVGAAILGHDNSVASVGYNGAPAGVSIDWSDRDARRPYVIHAEANALRYVQPGQGRLLAVTLMPCIECLKTAKAYGIDNVVYSSNLDNPIYDVGQIHAMAFEFGMVLRMITS